MARVIVSTRSIAIAVFLIAAAVGFGHPRPMSPPAPEGSLEVEATAPGPVGPVRQWITPAAGGRLEHQGVRLEVPAGALSEPAWLTLEALASDAMPKLGAALDNVTAPFACLRLGPDGTAFAKPLSLTLPFDPARLPPGTGPEDVRTYFFDRAARRWIALERIAVDSGASTVTSRTGHFSDFVNAVLVSPDSPQGTNFEANSLSQISVADPGSGITLIEAPAGSPTGDAGLDFPLELPPGRLGIQPGLAVTYSSGRGNGWLGLGWNLDVPNVQVDTAFGVPQYNPALETETYRLDGDPLAPVADLVQPVPRQPDRVFTRRVEGSFERIVRKGSAPDNYWWEVTDQNGTRFLYGQSAAARLQDYQAPYNAFRWNLERIIDLHGNSVEFTYFTDSGSNGEPWVQVYPQQIAYTRGTTEEPYYRVDFIRDDGGRSDRLSSGLPGFKTFTRFRLDRVDVTAGGELVRRYSFLYRDDDFRQSLLEAIAVTGQDPAAELYRHGFEYYTMPTRPGGEIDGFSDETPWEGMSASDDATHSTSFSAGVHSFVGLAPNPVCQFHAGAQVGFSGGASSTERLFLDVNGDGLPDRLDQDGLLELNRNGSFEPASFAGTTLLSRTNDLQFDFGAGIHSPGELAQAGASWVWSHANDDQTVADVNGDGWPDLVSTQGGFDVRLNDRGSRFLSPVTWTGFSFEGIDLAVPEEQQQVLDNFPLSNSLRRLVLPYGGRVTLAGAIQKKLAGGVDGVDVTIYRNGSVLWQRHFAPADTSPCDPGPGNSCGGGLAVDVTAGDRLDFMADSIADTADDALLWAPSATYAAGDPAAREPYGAPIFVFDAGDDFRLAGPPGGDWLAVADGKVEVSGAIVKQVTGDDAVVTITRASSDDESVEPVTLYTRSLAAGQTGSFSDFPVIDVAQGDVLRFAVESESQIDPDLVVWTPAVAYQEDVSPLQPELESQPAQVLTSVHNPLPLDVPTVFWSAPGTADYEVAVDWQGPAAGHQAPVTLYVQGLNRLFDKRTIPVSENAAHYSLSLDLAQDQALYVTVLAAYAADAGTLTATANGAGVPTNRRWTDPEGEALSGGYHRWYYGEWNGSVPFQEPVEPESDDLIAGMPQWQGMGQVSSTPVWRAAGFDLYHAAEGSKPSRRGGNVVVELGVAGASGDGPQVVRKTYGNTIAANISTPVSFTLGTGENVAQIDLLDMNGDFYPDQVAEGKVRFSNGHGAFGPLVDVPGFGSFREVTDGTYSLGIGLGMPFSRKNGNGKPKQVVNTMPSVGRTISFSQPRTDLVDVNGDGLPDLVSMEPDTESVTVSLNLGYRFGAAETWLLPAWTSRELCDDFLQIPAGELLGADSPDALGLTRSVADNAGLAIGPIGGGVETNLTRGIVELADINGDGLVDHLFKDQGEDFFRVKLNLGDRWADEAPWYVPPWQTSLGGIYNPLGLFQCLDAVTLQGVISGNGSVGAPICIPLVPPVPVAGLQIEIAVQGGGGGGGVQLLFDDLNGDGLADQVLKKDGDPKVYSKLNKAAQVNLLKTVTRPLGGSFDLGYTRQGNRVDYGDPSHRIDMPATQWVLSSVSLDDGQGNVYETAYDYFDDAFYDREERQEYGYARVQATLGDGSTLDTRYHNQDYYLRNLPAKVERRDAAGFLFLAETSTYELREVAPQSFFPARVRQETFFYEGTTKDENGYGVSTARTFDYDPLGNVILVEDPGDSGLGDDLRVEISYTLDPALYWVRPERLEAESNGLMLRERRGVHTALGDLERLVETLTGGRNPETGEEYVDAEVETSFTYRADGNLETVTDASGYTLTYTYDEPTQTHVAGIEDSFAYTTAIEYDLKYGLPAAITDENGNVLRQVYDGFGRLAEVFAPGDPAGQPSILMTYAPGAAPPHAVTDHRDVTSPGDPIRTAVFVNGLGQQIQTKRDTTFDSGGVFQDGLQVSGRIVFDERARIQEQGQPIFSTSSLTGYVDVPLLNPTGFTYDVLDRVRKVAYPQGAATRIEYGFGELDGTKRLLQSRIDALGRTTKLYGNVNGSVIGVEQQSTAGGTPVTLLTRYGYDALQELLSVTDPKGNVTAAGYDTLGRQIVIDNPDAGRSESRYSLAGNLGATITANLAAAGEQINYFYTFHRLDLIDYPETPDAAFTYGPPGAACNSANRLVTVTDESGVEQRCYSALGQTVESKKTANTLKGSGPLGPFVTTFTYDNFNRLLGIGYPDGEQLTYGFDAGGRVTSASGVKSSDTTVYVSRVGYDQFGALVEMAYGNGVVERRSYDPKSRFLANLTAAGGSAGTFQNLIFTRDAVGSIQQIANQVDPFQGPIPNGPVVQTFLYDDLYRLVHAEGTYDSPPNKRSAYTLDLVYDELSNLTRKNQLHTIQSGGGPPIVQKKTTYDWTYLYQGQQPDAPSHIGERTYLYDDDGNQTGWNDDSNGLRRTITWDEQNRVESVADQGRTTRFLYNAAGERTNKQGAQGETVYVNPYFSIRNGTLGSKQLFVDQDRVATQIVQPTSGEEPPSEKKLYFYHGDDLGSTEFVTDPDGELFQHFEYFPFGEGWVEESSVDQRTPYNWVSKELDEQTGLYYFGFRYFEPSQSQWLSADPILDGMLDSSALATPDLSVLPYRQPGQMYAYTSNDPINLVDPTGLMMKRKREAGTVSSSSSSSSSSSAPPQKRQSLRQNPTLDPNAQLAKSLTTGAPASVTVSTEDLATGKKGKGSIITQAVVKVNGVSYKWFGAGAKPASAQGAFDARDYTVAGFKEPGVAGIAPLLQTAAGNMGQNQQVCCVQGRERSSFHVFAALYVTQGLSKMDAARSVVAGVTAAQGPKKAAQTVGLFTESNWFLGLSNKYVP